ncbi:xylulokinase [Tessaracoccus sp. OS52]|uniref:xylulokinase n=1 Tax=Tessaracoccus sp. OS52 TaxID=2886691 RepID=UPI001D107EE4|nr:xylulokinase [Tessaracoccus sp. OS52]MCC2593266.1 xylulokinase [Tessaracoccus sp. OS52]
MSLVAGIDSSTQSSKVVVADAATGAIVREGRARHPEGTSVAPGAWWSALQEAIEQAGGLGDVEAISVSGQQHGMVCLDADGEVVRDALLWNDTRSGQAASDLVAELGDGSVESGRRAWAQRVGSVPVASLTVTKLRWLADAEPDNMDRVAAVCLPHDWLTWKLSGSSDVADLVTDRSDASGTGYFDSTNNTYLPELLELATRRDPAGIRLPRVAGPSEVVGRYGGDGAALGPGCGDNAGGALGLGLAAGMTSVSLGTSGVVGVVSDTPVNDPSGLVAGFADATGRYLPLAVTLNGAQILDAAAKLLDVDHDELSRLALAAAADAGGAVLVPYFGGERTPNLPTAQASLHGLTHASFTRQNLARAAFNGLLCLLAEGMEAIKVHGVQINEVVLTGGAARSRAVQELAPRIFGTDVVVPTPGEYVALGAARQAAWVLAGGDTPPQWQAEGARRLTGEHDPAILARYREFRQWSE